MSALLRNPRAWLGLGISAVALYFALRGVDWATLAEELGRADYAWLLPAAAAIVLGQGARAARWRFLFGAHPRPSLRDAFAILSIGYLVSAVFPLRLGDPVRAWLVETRTPADGAVALATVLVERVVDLLTILVLLAVIVPEPAARLLGQQLGPGPWSRPSTLLGLTLAAVALVYAGMLLASFFGPRLGRGLARGLEALGLSRSRARRLGTAAAAFATGLGALRRRRSAGLTAGASVGVWLIGALGYWLVARAFALELSYGGAVFVMCATAVFAILPSSPGYVGVFHSAVILALAIFARVPKEVALSYAIVLHGLTIVVLLGLGMVGLRMVGLSRHGLQEHLQGMEAGPESTAENQAAGAALGAPPESGGGP